MRRRFLLASLTVSIVLVATAVAIALLRDNDRGPIPSASELRRTGFAVWPQDTVKEGLDACEHAESWQHDPKQTAFRFARDVLHYPSTVLNTKPNFGSKRPVFEVSYLVGSDDVRGVFLGSMIAVRKYDRCWFVVRVDPREGGWEPAVSFDRGPPARLIVAGYVGASTEVGYGSWSTTISDPDGKTVPVPSDVLNETGHIMTFGRAGTSNRGDPVLDVTAFPLGSKKQSAAPAPTSSPLRGPCRANQKCLNNGLRYEDVKNGVGAEAKKGDTVKVTYVGMLSNGTVFDTSKRHTRGYLSFKLGAGIVIQGWDEGVPGMKVGGERKLTIPPELGYGSAGYPPSVPPNATLIFDIKLLDVKSK